MSGSGPPSEEMVVGCGFDADLDPKLIPLIGEEAAAVHRDRVRNSERIEGLLLAA